jgi:hypothetical protein
MKKVFKEEQIWGYSRKLIKRIISDMLPDEVLTFVNNQLFQNSKPKPDFTDGTNELKYNIISTTRKGIIFIFKTSIKLLTLPTFFLITILIRLDMIKKFNPDQQNNQSNNDANNELITEHKNIISNISETKSNINADAIVINNNNITIYDNTTHQQWLIVHASEIGKSHLSEDPSVPCQDNHACWDLKNGWGIAVSCDGAGSAKLSHEGSKFISVKAIELFKSIVEENNWINKNELPNGDDWTIIAKKTLLKLRYDLDQFALSKALKSSDLACTIILLIYSPIGILTTHIGDGRAGYRNQNNEWKAIITPHKGEEANHTIFITSNAWLSDNFIMSGVKVPESNVINDSPSAFTLLTDGCESHSFELGYFDNEQQRFIEKNNPYPKFFEPLTRTIIEMKKAGLTMEEINEKWSAFIREGTDNLLNEPDDKTLILGVINK